MVDLAFKENNLKKKVGKRFLLSQEFV